MPIVVVCTQSFTPTVVSLWEEVDALAGKAIAAGGAQTNEPQDLGFMYSRSFQDPDGNMWETFWMDPAHVE